MRLAFFGAAQTVTGSMHMLMSRSGNFILDCGLFQGRRQQAHEINSSFPFSPQSIHGVVLSHAHLDHSGNLPGLVKHGFQGTIHATAATRDLCRSMLADSAHLQQKDFEFILKRQQRRRRIGIEDLNHPTEPLYDSADVDRTMGLFQAHDYHSPVRLSEDIKFSFTYASHILGSAVTLLTETAGRKTIRLLFSGDLGRPTSPILKQREAAPEADYLILESTYGDRVHEDFAQTENTLAELIIRTVQKGGHVVVPAFAVGRVQQLVLMLHRLAKRNAIPKVPIFVDSPLAVDVTKVFQDHLDELGGDAAAFVSAGQDPFGFSQLRYLREASESKVLNDLRTPYVVISPSGMCEGGRVLHHLQNSVEDERNLILITGYQAANTLGRKISEHQPEVRIYGEPMKLRAQVAAFNELSAHSDQHELLDWVRPIAQGLKTIFLVHGEGAAQTTLASILRDQLNLTVVVPKRGEQFDLT